MRIELVDKTAATPEISRLDRSRLGKFLSPEAIRTAYPFAREFCIFDPVA
jgi:hypothetical protein